MTFEKQTTHMGWAPPATPEAANPAARQNVTFTDGALRLASP